MQAMQQVLALVRLPFMQNKFSNCLIYGQQSKHQRRDSESESHWNKSASCAWNTIMCKI